MGTWPQSRPVTLRDYGNGVRVSPKSRRQNHRCATFRLNLFAQPALGANAEAVAGQTGLRLDRPQPACMGQLKSILDEIWALPVLFVTQSIALQRYMRKDGCHAGQSGWGFLRRIAVVLLRIVCGTGILSAGRWGSGPRLPR